MNPITEKATKPTEYMKLLGGWHEKKETLQKLAKNMKEALTFSSDSKLLPLELALVQGKINKNIKIEDIKKEYKYTSSEMNEIIKRLKKIEEIIHKTEGI